MNKESLNEINWEIILLILILCFAFFLESIISGVLLCEFIELFISI